MIFWAFVFIRVLMAFLSWGYFVPDETWQSVEVAHKLGTVHVFTVKSTPVRFAGTFYIITNFSCSNLLAIFLARNISTAYKVNKK